MTTPDERNTILLMLRTQAADIGGRFERWRAMAPLEVLAELGPLRAELHYLDDTLADLVLECKAAADVACLLPPGTSRLGVELEGAA